MTDSRHLAGLIGPTIAIGASEVWTFRIWGTNIAPLISLNGVLLFVAGLAIVCAHNRWTRGWSVVITLVGWVGILGGLFRMFAAGIYQRGSATTSATVFMVLEGLLLIVGLFMTFKAYTRDGK